MEVAEDVLYTKEHEWIKIEGDTAYVGITDYAQSALGDITFIELPEAGVELEQFEQMASIESVKAANDIFTPMSGKVIEVNSLLEDKPELINKSCFEKGWIAKIELNDINEKANLMTPQEYGKLLESLDG